MCVCVCVCVCVSMYVYFKKNINNILQLQNSSFHKMCSCVTNNISYINHIHAIFPVITPTVVS